MERLPSLFLVVVRRVEQDAMRVQMRIERTRRVVLKKRGDDIAGHTVAMLSTGVNLRRSKSLQL